MCRHEAFDPDLYASPSGVTFEPVGDGNDDTGTYRLDCEYQGIGDDCRYDQAPASTRHAGCTAFG